MNSAKYEMITILGPTACGKTRIAAQIAAELDGEVVSADSRQVYRHMDLGTGKDYGDYSIDGVTVPCHLIDIANPGEKYNVYQYQQDFFIVYDNIRSRGKLPVLCGGTGMYIDAVTKGYNLYLVPPDQTLRKELENKSLPELQEILASYKKLHNRSDADTKKRAIRAIEIAQYYRDNPQQVREYPVIKNLFVGLQMHPEILRGRIFDRLSQRLKQGMVEEVSNLIDQGLSFNDLEYYGLEYRFISLFLQSQLTFEEMKMGLFFAICQFAKRQRTWFRKMEREGAQIFWIDAGLSPENVMKVIKGLYFKKEVKFR